MSSYGTLGLSGNEDDDSFYSSLHDMQYVPADDSGDSDYEEPTKKVTKSFARLKRKLSSEFPSSSPRAPKKARVTFDTTAPTSHASDEEQESDTSKKPNDKPINKSGQPRKQRAPRPKLIKWTENDWKQAVLAIVHACGESGIAIPFDKAAKVVNESCSGGAFQQAILKLRSKLIDEGRDVPTLRMCWTKKNNMQASDMPPPRPVAVKNRRDLRKVARKPTQDKMVQVGIHKFKVPNLADAFRKDCVIVKSELDAQAPTGEFVTALDDAPRARRLESVGYQASGNATPEITVPSTFRYVSRLQPFEDETSGNVTPESMPIRHSMNRQLTYTVDPIERMTSSHETDYPLGWNPTTYESGRAELEIANIPRSYNGLPDNTVASDNDPFHFLDFSGVHQPTGHFEEDHDHMRERGVGTSGVSSNEPFLLPSPDFLENDAQSHDVQNYDAQSYAIRSFDVRSFDPVTGAVMLGETTNDSDTVTGAGVLDEPRVFESVPHPTLGCFSVLGSRLYRTGQTPNPYHAGGPMYASTYDVGLPVATEHVPGLPVEAHHRTESDVAMDAFFLGDGNPGSRGRNRDSGSERSQENRSNGRRAFEIHRDDGTRGHGRPIDPLSFLEPEYHQVNLSRYQGKKIEIFEDNSEA